MKLVKTVIFLIISLICVFSVFADDATTQVSVNNVGPTVDSITISPDDDLGTAGVQIDAIPGSNKTVTVVVEVSDSNGVDDIDSVTTVVLGIAPPTTLTNCTQIDTDTSSCTGTFQISTANPPGFYNVTVTVDDDAGVIGTLAQDFEIVSQVGLQIDFTTVSFGSLNPGQTSSVTGDFSIATSSDPTISNLGNTVIDIDVKGTELTGPVEDLGVGTIDYRIGSSSFAALTTSDVTDDTNLGVGQTVKMDFDLNVPIGILPGTYSGTVTLTPVLS